MHATVNRRTVLRILYGSLVAAPLALAGCGQKGPLYLPEEKLQEIERKRRRSGAPSEGQPGEKTGAVPGEPAAPGA